MLGWPAVMHLWLVGLQPRDGGQVRREGRCWHPVLGLGLCLLSLGAGSMSVVSECFCLRLGTLRAWPQNVIPCPFPGAQDRAHSTVT